MAETTYSNIIDPEVIEASVGNSWVNSMKFMRYAPQIFARDTRPIAEGTLVSQVRNTIFQGSQGQAVAADGTISSVGRVQTKASHPVLWRYGSVKEADVMAEIMPTVASGNLNAAYAEAAREAGAHYLENSLIAMIEGTGSALTSNQAGSGATVTLDLLADGLAALADEGTEIAGGASFSRSPLYWKVFKLGLVAATSNTFGNAAQDEMVRSGKMIGELLGTVYFATDKLSAAPDTDDYFFFVGPGAIALRGNEAPQIEAARLTVNGQFGWIVNLKVKFACGFNGVKWVGSTSETTSDVALATAANWQLADTDSKYVKIARVLSDNA